MDIAKINSESSEIQFEAYQELREAVALALPRLSKITEGQAQHRYDPLKWSVKEILGHLIDSAINNTSRFIIASTLEELIFDGYDQEYWVKFNQYQNRDWTDIIDTWARFNHNLSLIIECIPSEVYTKDYNIHNFDRIAFRTVPTEESTSIAYFVNDYIVHINHHLDQIFKQSQ